MPNPLQHIEKHPDRSKDILGIEYEQWLTLVKIAKIEEEKIRLAREQEKIWINKKGGGRPKKLKRDEEKTPQKKPSGKELTDLQKDANKEISSERIYVEHVIRLIKIFRAAKERFRMKGNKYEGISPTQGDKICLFE
jgi:DDE superfamily endonuclease